MHPLLFRRLKITQSAVGKIIVDNMSPIYAGVFAAIVGFTSSFGLLLNSFQHVGASVAQASSGLAIVVAAVGVLSICTALVTRTPISFAWSTPGAALLITTNMQIESYPVIVGCYLVAAIMIAACGLSRRICTIVFSVPTSIASSVLAGILFDICMSPFKAAIKFPGITSVMLIAWLVAKLFVPRLGIIVSAIASLLYVFLSHGTYSTEHVQIDTYYLLIAPEFSWPTILSVSVPLFIVTMTAQNIPGVAIMKLNGYCVPVRPIVFATALVSGVTAMFGGIVVNMAAITAGLCAGSDVHHDRDRRWIATLTSGIVYVVLGISSSIFAYYALYLPSIVIQSLAGLALLRSFESAMKTALSESENLPEIATFLTVVSGINIRGISSPFWAFLCGIALYTVFKYSKNYH